jgi:hypothetical protein
MDQLQKIETPLSDVPPVQEVIKENATTEAVDVRSDISSLDNEMTRESVEPSRNIQSWRDQLKKQLKYFNKDVVLGILSVCIIILSTFFTPKAPYFTLKSHRHNLVGVIALAIVLFIAYKFNPVIAIGFSVVYAIAMILHKMWRKRQHKVIISSANPEKAKGPINRGAEIGELPTEEIPQRYTPDEPITCVSESDMQSLCAHLHQIDKNATDEIVTSADFSELVNTEHACNFAKHQYVNLPPVSRASNGIAEGVME